MPDTNRVVFVVGDEVIIAQTLAIILNQAGFQASAFDHPEKAIAASAELALALLISDVMMPGMTGVELAIHFRKSHPKCKVLLFSGQALTAERSLASSEPRAGESVDCGLPGSRSSLDLRGASRFFISTPISEQQLNSRENRL